MVSKSLLVFCALVVVASAIPPQPGAGGWGGSGVNPWLPSWISSAPWMPKFNPCTTIGSSCVDCNTKLICTKIGSIQRVCTDPKLPYCNLGECSATPTDQCAPAAPAETAA